MFKCLFPPFFWRWQAWVLGFFLLVGGSVRAQGTVEKTPHGLLIRFEQAQVELAPATSDALRLSVVANPPSPVASSSFLADPNAGNSVAWREVEKAGWVGIETKAGTLLLNPQSGEWTLQNAKGETLIPQHEIGGLNQAISATRPQIEVMLGWNPQTPITVYGGGNGVAALEQTKGKTGVSNGEATLPYYWSKAGYAVLAVTADDNQPARWRGATNGEYVTWTFPGSRADLYLMPAASLKDAAGAYARLTGAAPVPPRWALGYLQSRWGWTNRPYIEDTLKHFHDLNLPVDAFIYDFEWYALQPDYSLPAQGQAGFQDFGWNTNLFNEPAAQVKAYQDQGVRFVGIRKPRLGNDDSLVMLRAKHWNMPVAHGEKFQARDMNFRNPELREWYVSQSSNLLQAGVDGWWNDEGEATFTTYFYWNLAEREAINRYRPGQRLWTLNRAFSPGTQKFGAGAWTGDVRSSWKVLAETPTSLLNWSLAGMPYGACDIGGFSGHPSPELLSRWMEAGVFFPIMRTHSEINTQPHFPWLYGPAALDAMRKALDLRYRLIPYYYSLAHETFETGVPLMRPLVMEFPEDPRVANLSDEWLMGRSLLAAPVLQAGGQRSVYLPAGDWFVFGTHQILNGSCTFETNAALDEIPLYVRAGTILPLGPVIEHTRQLPGGPLELQVYRGQDATFTLVEDDGSTMNYQNGKIRRTTFKWDEAQGRLSWQRDGAYSGRDVFRKLHVVVFDSRGKTEAEHRLNSSGKINL
jgi:alpha-glucosidase